MKALAMVKKAWRAFRWALLRSCAPHGKKRLSVLIGVLALTLIWQVSLSREGAKLDGNYGIRGLSGLHNESTFVYFLWYENLFPVASTLAVGPCGFRCEDSQPSGAPADLSKEAADRVLREHPESLVMDLGWTWNGGDRGKVFLFLPDVIMKGEPFAPSVKPMHRGAWILSLWLLFFAAWRTRRPWLGVAMVVLLGSDPLQLLEVYNYPNVFGWSITCATFLVALHFAIIARPRVTFRRAIWLPIVTGLFMASVRTFRSEPMPLLLGPAILYLGLTFVGVAQKRATWLRRFAFAATLTTTFVTASVFWDAWVERKTADASEELARIGGHPFPGSMRMHHHFWHPVWCGLGDFDKKHGYEWRDGAALEYATPILQEKFHEYVPTSNFADRTHDLNEYLDKDFIYKRMPYSIPNYDEVVRDKVLSDIAGDPIWYLGILGQRMWRILTDSTPVRISAYQGWVQVAPMSGLNAVVFFILCVFARAKFAARLIAFTAPSITTALVVYSGGGVHLYAIFHVFAAAILWTMIGMLLFRAGKNWRLRRTPKES